MSTAGLSRRHALAGAATVGLGLPLLAACGGDEGGEATDSGDQSEPPAGPIATAGDIPEGGGTIFEDEQVVITQPTAGEFLAFTAVCTHQGCVVAEVTDTINCACHGSQYSIEDGSVVGGPAPAPLAKQEITVEGDDISLA